MADRHNKREVPQRKVSQKKKGTHEGQVPVCRLLCEVSGDCQAVLRTLLDREVRGRLITILRGKGEVLYIALCGLRSWVSSTERFEQRVLVKMAKGDAARAKSNQKSPHRSLMTGAASAVWNTFSVLLLHHVCASLDNHTARSLIIRVNFSFRMVFLPSASSSFDSEAAVALS